MKMSKQDKENMIKKMVEEDYHSIQVPDPTESWNKMHPRLQKYGRKKIWANRLKIAFAVVILAFVVDTATNADIPKTYAHVSTLFRDMKDRVAEYFFNRTNDQGKAEALTIPPPADTEAMAEIPKETTLAEAKEKLIFPLLQPDFLPNTFTLNTVRVYQESGQYNHVYLEYVNDSGEIFKLVEMYIGKSEVRSTLSLDAGQIKEKYIGKDPAVLMLMPEMTYLEWVSDDVKVTISGKLNEQEIIQIAESLR